MGYSSGGHKESDRTEPVCACTHTHTHTHTHTQGKRSAVTKRVESDRLVDSDKASQLFHSQGPITVIYTI